jgi:multiple sugar transport system substrate-binding protein
VQDVVISNKKWKALPWGNIGQLEDYRTDWFKEGGVNKFPTLGGPARRRAAA